MSHSSTRLPKQQASSTHTLIANASAHLKPVKAEAALQAKLGFPKQQPADWQQQAIAKLGEVKSKYRSLQVFLDSCMKCGACTDKCHYYLGTSDPKNMPVARQDLLRSVYRRYYTLSGKYFPKLVGAKDLTEEVLDDWYTYFNQCSECRRCSVYCPLGIDTAEFAMAARDIMNSIGIGQKYTAIVVDNVLERGNNLGMPGPVLQDTLDSLEEDIQEDTGVAVRLPIDQAGAEILLVTPSADFFAEPHVDGLIGYAKVFHQVGQSWTLSSTASEAANFALFSGNFEQMQTLAARIKQAALELGVKRIVFGECGHAWRVGYSFLNTLVGPLDFLDSKYPQPEHICETTYRYLFNGALKLDPSVNDDMVLTYHDSCNVARASRMGVRPGAQFEIPRALLRAAANRFFDMRDDSIRDASFCCGAGGGLLMDHLMELRIKGALPRMQALQQVVKQHGVTHMAAICAICKSQFAQVLPHYGFELDQIVSLHQVVGNAVKLGEEWI